MSKTSSNLLFLAIGAAIGAAIGYVAAADKDKKEEWMNEISGLVNKVKTNAKDAVNKGKEQLDKLNGNATE